jgi:hypothetical protein
MITDIDVVLAEKLGFTHDCPEKTAKAKLIAAFREDAVTRELESMLKTLEAGLLEIGVAQRKVLQVQQDVDVQAWSRYAAALLSTVDEDLGRVMLSNYFNTVAASADRMLALQKQRFPSIT